MAPANRYWATAALAIALLLGGRGIAAACSCVTNGNGCGAVDAAEIVFEATVDTIAPAPQDAIAIFHMHRVAFSEVRRIRGGATDAVLTPTESTACGFSFSRGARYLVFASKDTAGRVVVTRCGLTRLATQAEHLIPALERPTDLNRAGTVFGTFRGESTEASIAPIAGARIVLQGPVNRSTLTEPDGTFSVQGLPMGRYALLATPPSSSLHLWPSGAEVELNFRSRCSEHQLFAATRGRIVGQLVGPAGQPLAGAFIELVAAVGPWGRPGISLQRLARTDAQGRYEFSRLAAGTYSVGVNLWEGASAVNPYNRAVARTGSGEDYFPLRLGDEVDLPALAVFPLQRVQGSFRVQHADGRPAGGVRFSLAGVGVHDRNAGDASTVTGRTDQAGVASVELWPGVPYLLTIGSGEKPLVRIRVVGGAELVRVVVP